MADGYRWIRNYHMMGWIVLVAGLHYSCGLLDDKSSDVSIDHDLRGKEWRTLNDDQLERACGIAKETMGFMLNSEYRQGVCRLIAVSDGYALGRGEDGSGVHVYYDSVCDESYKKCMRQSNVTQLSSDQCSSLTMREQCAATIEDVVLCFQALEKQAPYEKYSSHSCADFTTDEARIEALRDSRFEYHAVANCEQVEQLCPGLFSR